MATRAQNHNRGGRPGRSRLNVVTAANILNSLAGGAYVRTACQFAGIHHTTYGLWRRRGEDETERVNSLGLDAGDLITGVAMKDHDGTQRSVGFADMVAARPEPFDEIEWPYVVFLFLSEKSRATAEIRNLQIIQTAAGDTWQAAAWILERTHPELYGRRERINLEGSTDGSPVQVQTVSVDDLEAQIKALRDGKQ